MSRDWDWINTTLELQQVGKEFVLVTVVEVSGSTPRERGARMIVERDGKIHGTIGGGNLEALAIAEAQKNLASGTCKKASYPLCAKAGQCCGGYVEIFFEPFYLKPRVLIFGVGHVGQALANVLCGTPFEVTAFDSRADWLEHENLARPVIRKTLTLPFDLDTQSMTPSNTFAVIMTHSHDLDYQLVRHLIPKNLRYLGLIGSHLKWSRFQQNLRRAGLSPEELARVTSPIGLFKTGKSPQEIAISTAAELLKHYNRKSHV